MVRRWRARLVAAHLDHWQLGFLASRLAPLLTALEHGHGAWTGRLGALVLLRFARRARRLLFAAVAVAAVTLLTVTALLVVVASQLI